MSEPLHTVRQVAERLKLHPKTVLRLIHEGRLKASRIGKSYRIPDSDLRAFASLAGEGDASPAREQARARVTCIAEVEDLTLDEAQRVANVLSAIFMAHDPDRDPVHMTTAYDPRMRRLKAVLIAAPDDAAGWLRLLHAQLQNLP